MSEFDDHELDHPTAASPTQDDGTPSRWPRVLLAVVAALALIAAAYFFLVLRNGEEPAAPEPAPLASEAPPPPSPTPEEAPESDLDLPPLDESDTLVRTLAGQLSEHPQLARWLGVESLVRRFTAAVDNIAEGTNPSSHLGFLRPQEPFVVREKDGLPHIDPASYRRYDRLTEVFVSLDSEQTAELYRQFKPLVQKAYEDLGYPDRDFDRTLQRAIRQLRSVPVPEGDVALTPRVLTYAYSDPDLESLTPAQRSLLRTGPENARRIQAKLAELEAALEL